MPCVTAITCHLHFWQNDSRVFQVHATGAIRRGNGWGGGGDGHQNKSTAELKVTLEKKILCRSCRDSNPRPFNQSRVRRSNCTEPSPLLPVFSSTPTVHYGQRDKICLQGVCVGGGGGIQPVSGNTDCYISFSHISFQSCTSVWWPD